MHVEIFFNDMTIYSFVIFIFLLGYADNFLYEILNPEKFSLNKIL